jgi:hypothetical protein
MHAAARLEILIICTTRNHWVPGYPYMLLAAQELVEAVAKMQLPATLRMRAQDFEVLTDLERQLWHENGHMEGDNEGKQRYGKGVSDEEWETVWLMLSPTSGENKMASIF